MAEGDETPGNDPPEGGDIDFLAARRARRGEPRDLPLARRAEAAEATVRTLETHLSSLQGRLRELESEQQRSAEQLAEREQEVRRVKQREYAEQQLRVEAEESHERLQRERRAEVDRLNRRLVVGERHARELADQLESARRELAEAEQAAAAEQAALRRSHQELVLREADLGQRELALDRTRTEVERRLVDANALERRAQELNASASQEREALAGRLASLEDRANGFQRALASERAARERSEQSLTLTRESHARLELIVGDLKQTAVALRGAVERERSEPTEIPGPASPVEVTPSSAPVPVARAAAPGPPGEEIARRAEMAEALAAAVERLRARVAAVGEDTDADTDTDDVQSDEAVEFKPRVFVAPTAPVSWLAPAIRRVAERRDGKLAGELIVELLPAQCLTLEGRVAYGVKIAELGDFRVRVENGQARVERAGAEGEGSRAKGPGEQLDFELAGPAVAFSEFAAGGTGRRLPGVSVSGRRRRLRRLLAARRPPFALAELVDAGMRVWPGLLLLALAEAIEPVWTLGVSFVVAFSIETPEGTSAIIHVRVHDGEPLVVTRVRGDRPQSILHLSERSFLRLVAGLGPEAEERLMLQGDARPLEQLIGWIDRVQGVTTPV